MSACGLDWGEQIGGCTGFDSLTSVGTTTNYAYETKRAVSHFPPGSWGSAVAVASILTIS